MSQSIRQSELFAGNDWLAIYRAFTQINFNSSDFNSIKSSMVDYIRLNYPEDFNDWISSSEFVAIIDLLSYLGQNLAFITDLNARENFIDIARRRESVLRLAKFLSYSPKRNYPASGLVKLTELKTNQDVYDSFGNNLNGVSVKWNDPSNENWYEQWIMILNSCLIKTNLYGTPLDQKDISGVQTQLYRIDNIPGSSQDFIFSANVNGQSLPFDVANITFNEYGGISEQYPSYSQKFQIVYRNDGNGNGSNNTGFFLLVKQGRLSKSDYIINEPIENNIIDINIDNINETDIWVQSVNDAGNILSNGIWTRVGSTNIGELQKITLSTENITYNSINPDVENIYQVETREQDQISIRFGDGRFGKIPSGNIRIWHRISANQNIRVKPEDIQNVQIIVPYISDNNVQKRITMKFSLFESLSNGVQTETNDEIRSRASQVYSTQARMVSGSDYNNLPISTNLALKVKATNRIYSGQSKYIDLNDPTGSYQNTLMFANDGALYKENYLSYEEISFSSNISNQEIAISHISPLMDSYSIRDFLYDEWLQGIDKSSEYDFKYSSPYLVWKQSTNRIYSSTGIFYKDNLPYKIGSEAQSDTIEYNIQIGSMIKFKKAGWVTVININQNGSDIIEDSGEGAIVLNQSVKSDDVVIQILPSISTVSSNDLLLDIISFLNSKRSFGIGYNYKKMEWYFIDSVKMNPSGEYNFNSIYTNSDSSWLIKCEYTNNNWKIISRGIRYIFESKNKIKFYFSNKFKSIDPQTGKVGRDNIVVLKNNNNPRLIDVDYYDENKTYEYGDIVKLSEDDSGMDMVIYYESIIDNNIHNPNEYNGTWKPVISGLKSDIQLDLNNTYSYDNGMIEPKKIQILFSDKDDDGQPDNPESFYDICGSNIIFFENTKDIYGNEITNLRTDIIVVDTTNDIPDDVINGNIIYNKLDETFYMYINGELTIQTNFFTKKGRNNINFNWTHYAPSNNRIDPSLSNIIDIFVLNREYYERMVNWRNNNGTISNLPKPTSELQLKLTYSSIEQYKMFSDEIIWRSPRFKLLFGVGASAELKAKFKVVKLPGTTVSDGEIKSRMLEAIEVFFDVNNWDFGETFYFTELAAFIHQRLLNAISSVVIVPMNENDYFGQLFEVKCNPDEIFFSTAQVSDIEIIPSNTNTSLRIK